MLIHERSRGIPRTISVICDNALLSGFALGRQPVDREIVLEVSRDFDLVADETKILGPLPSEGFVTVEMPEASSGEQADELGDDRTDAGESFNQVAEPRRFRLFGSAQS